MKLAAYRVELPAPTHLKERLEVPSKRAKEHPKGLLFSRHLEVACDRRRDGESFASQSWHTTLPSNLPLPLGQKTLQEEEALQNKDLRPPCLASQTYTGPH